MLGLYFFIFWVDHVFGNFSVKISTFCDSRFLADRNLVVVYF